MGDWVYAINTLNNVSSIEAVNAKTKESKMVDEPGAHFTTLIATAGKVFAISQKPDEQDPEKMREFVTMSVFTPELQFIRSMDITNIGRSTGQYCEDERFLYLTIRRTAEDRETGKILKVDKETYAIEEIPLPDHYPFAMIPYQDHFVLTYYDPVHNVGSKVAIIDKEGNELSRADLQIQVSIAEIMGDQLVIANDHSVSLYSLPDFKRLKEYPFELKHQPFHFYTMQLLILD